MMCFLSCVPCDGMNSLFGLFKCQPSDMIFSTLKIHIIPLLFKKKKTEEQKVQRPPRRASQDEEEEPMQETITNTISSIFFPKRGDTESILLKRGPVLVDGEERELMVFTYGFVLSRVELDMLVNLLLNATSANSSSSGKEDLTLEQVAERFCSLDADGSGSKYYTLFWDCSLASWSFSNAIL